jgi:Protein of unknown function (DUF1501)
MSRPVPDEPWRCPGVTRRSFLADTGMGFTGVALAAMLARDRNASAAEPEPSAMVRPLVPRAKAIIWIFLCGGVSHVESFDPKPELNRFAGKSIDSTPYKDVLNPEKLKDIVSPNPMHGGRKVLMGLNTGFKKHGQSGLEVGDWWQNVGSCADDIAVVRSLWTSDNDHGAQLQFHTGRHVREGAHPTIGSWVAYGLGTLNENLPEYVVLGEPTGDCCGGSWTHGAAYLGPEHAGVRLNPDGKEPLPFVAPGAGMSREEQIAEFSLMGRLNRLAGIDYPDDPAVRARIKTYELAFGMQTAVPETLKLDVEPKSTQSLYGLDCAATRPFGRLCLAARRMVERGVRFVQIFHGGGGGGAWDAHAGIMANHGQLSSQVDLPIAGLLKDMKQRGLLDQTIVVWGTEFGRSPGAQADGRDHHPQGFCAWLAGGGVKGGVVHGATDEIGFHAVEDRHYVTDIHATVLHQLGLDPHKLEIPGRKRLEIDYGQPISQIIV